MAHEIVLPRLGWSMEEGTFVRWLKQDGDRVLRGEALFELEGEKALQDIEAVDEGILRIPPDAPPPGSLVPVGKVLGYLVSEGEPLPWQTAGAVRELRLPDEPNEVTIHASIPVVADAASVGADAGSIRHDVRPAAFASPRARRIAKELGVDWKGLSGSGAGGRIRERDVRAAAPAHSRPAADARPGTSLPISKRRRVIAERMVESRRQTVPVTLTARADATNLVNLREQFKSARGATVIPSYQDFITRLVAEVLKQHLLLASRWDEHSIVLPAGHEIHIGIAVDTDQGLLVPVIRDVGLLSMAALAAESRKLIERARAGQLTAGEMQGGVFTVTNLGGFGIDLFTPVINFPESAILGLGAIRREPVVLDDGRIAAREQMTLSLTFDHRHLDGAPAARFLQALTAAIANPAVVLLAPAT